MDSILNPASYDFPYPRIYPDSLQRAVQQDPNEEHAKISAAMEWNSAGYAILPTVGKRPKTIRGFFEHGVVDASRDREWVREGWLEEPSCNIGLATGHVNKLVILDIDYKNLSLDFDLAGFITGIPPTLTRDGCTGKHFYYETSTMPEVIVRSGILVPGVEIKGEGAYVNAPLSVHPSGDPYRFLDPAIPLAALPIGHPLIEPFTRPTTTADVAIRATPKRADSQKAGRVARKMLSGPFGANLKLLYQGAWEEVRYRDGSRRFHSHSEADLCLLYAAAWVTNDPSVLDAVLRQSGLCRSKWLHRPDYRAHQIARALQMRKAQHFDRLSILREYLDVTILPISAHSSPFTTETPQLKQGVGVGVGGRSWEEENANRRILTRADRRQAIISDVLMLATTKPKQHRRPDGWVRVPVSDLAELHCADRQTVTRTIERAAKQGQLETCWEPVSVNGQKRRDRLVRLPMAVPDKPTEVESEH